MTVKTRSFPFSWDPYPSREDLASESRPPEILGVGAKDLHVPERPPRVPPRKT